MYMNQYDQLTWVCQRMFLLTSSFILYPPQLAFRELSCILRQRWHIHTFRGYSLTKFSSCLFLNRFAKPTHKKEYKLAQYFLVIWLLLPNLRLIGHQLKFTSFLYSHHTEWKLRF